MGKKTTAHTASGIVTPEYYDLTVLVKAASKKGFIVHLNLDEHGRLASFEVGCSDYGGSVLCPTYSQALAWVKERP